jgi:hypothetical protein
LKLLKGPYVFGAPTSLLFQSDIVRSRYAFFNEANLHADKEVCFEFLEHADFGFVHQVLTFTRVREESLTSFAQNLQTIWPSILYDLVTYGPKYLSDEELKHKICMHFRNYYRYLGEQCYKQRGKEFWSYHRGKLAELGYPLNTFRLVTAAGSYVMDLVLNPKSTVEKAVRRLSQTLSRSSG